MSSSVLTKSSAEKFITFLRNVGYLSPVINEKVNGAQLSAFLYGPLGSLFRHNILLEWWNSSVLSSDENVFGLSSPLITWSSVKNTVNNGEILIPSGHVRQSLQDSALVQFESISQLVGGRLPFGIAHCGTTVNTSRTEKLSNTFLELPVEKYELTIQFFCSPSSSTQWFHYWQRKRFLWWRKFSSIPSKFSISKPKSESEDQFVQITYENELGLAPVETIHNRGTTLFADYTENKFQAKDGRKIVVPHVIECSTYLESAISVYLTDAFYERTIDQTTKTVLRLHPILAPYKTCVATSSGATSELRDLSAYLTKEIKKHNLNVIHFADSSQMSLEQQFTKSDEMGIPIVVIVNDSSLKSGNVILRDRDTARKDPVQMTDLNEILRKLLYRFD